MTDYFDIENRNLHYLSRYSRKIGIPAILMSSLLVTVIVGVSLYLDPSAKVLETALLNNSSLVLLIFSVLNSIVILINLRIMLNLFRKALQDFQKKGLPYASLSGVKGLQEITRREIRYANILVISSLFSLVLFLLRAFVPYIIYASVGLAFITFGFSMLKKEQVLDPDEILRLYEPSVFPSVMEINNFFNTFIDPFSRLRFDEYKAELNHYIKSEYSLGDALGKIFLILYQNLKTSLSWELVIKEITELFQDDTKVEIINNHPIFGFDRLKVIINKAERIIPEFFNLLDRLYMNLFDNLPEFREKDIYVSAECSWSKTRGGLCNAFILAHNNDINRTRNLTVSYQAPSFSPESSEVDVTLQPRDFDLPFDDRLPIHSDSGQDVVGLMSKVVDNMRILWFSFEAKESGNKPVIIRVKDLETGATIFGETFVVKTRYDLTGIIVRLLSILSVLGGIMYSIVWVFVAFT
jgi:hypothetical protein